MQKLIIKSFIFGFILGTVLFVIAPLGLGISLIENLRPVLIPGVLLLQQVSQSNASLAFVLSSVLLNGLIFSVLILIIFLFRSKFTE